ncbi:MAG TPA: DUF448 domain-containing protein [Desulfomicrobiaceae bacterium]|nr:DUF448 domain-containing protein [Desulfomicrobiaceae bacterium]HCF04888.1 DUF448 domain-containing protein [Desulfomicrobiaceae bacterium]
MRPRVEAPSRNDFPQKHRPVRTCVICRQRFEKDCMQRYLCPPPGGAALVPDPSGRQPGRGFYVCGNAKCQERVASYRGWRMKCKGERA